MSILDKFVPYLNYIEGAAIIAAGLIVWRMWINHDHAQQLIGEQRCQASIVAAVDEAKKTADELYAKQLKDKDDVINQYQADKDVQQRQHDLDLKQLRSYEDRLRASAVQGAPDAAGNPGPQIVRFTIESFEGFTGTCAEVAKDGQDDALALKMCKAYVDGLPHANN